MSAAETELRGMLLRVIEGARGLAHETLATEDETFACGEPADVAGVREELMETLKDAAALLVRPSPAGPVTVRLDAALAAIAEIRAFYPEAIFPPPPKGSTPDAFAAAGCRLVCDNVARALRELAEESR